jgi:hypothetical protein
MALCPLCLCGERVFSVKYMFALALVTGTPQAEEATVWVFFSPDSPDASRIFSELKGERVRTVLLVERYFGEREPAAPFLATIQAAGEVRVVDEEGLRKAKELGIRRLPAVAVVRAGRAHVASGTQADVKELLRCSK